MVKAAKVAPEVNHGFPPSITDQEIEELREAQQNGMGARQGAPLYMGTRTYKENEKVATD